MDLTATTLPHPTEGGIDFSAGIPQSSAPPDLVTPAFGENPWQPLERDRDAAAQQRRQEAMAKIDGVALDPDSYFKDKDLGFTRDPKKSQALAVNSAFMEFVTQGPVPLGETDLQRRLVRQDIAIRRWQGRGAESEEAFNGELVKEAQGRKDQLELANSVRIAAATAETLRREDLTEGKSVLRGFHAWKRENAGKPGYDKALEPEYFEAFQQTQTEVEEKLATFRPQLDGVFAAFERKENYADAARTAWKAMEPDDREPFLAALKVRAETLAQADRDSFFVNFFKQTGRDIGGNLADAAAGGQGAMLSGGTVGWEDFLGTDADVAAKNQRDSKAFRDFRDQADFVHQVVQLQQETYDPMRYLTNDGKGGTLEKMAYGAPGVFFTAVEATFAGPVLAASLQESHFQGFKARGLSEADAAEMAPVAAAIEFFSEKLGAKLLMGKLPFLEKSLGGAMDRITSAPVRFGARFAAGAVEEGGMEVGQNYIQPFVQDVAGALSKDLPDVQWLGKGGEFDGDFAENWDTFWMVAPLVIFGAAGGVMKDQAVQAHATATDEQLLAAGYAPDSLPTIRAGIEQGLASGAQAIEAAQQTRDPNSETAKAAVVQLQQQVVQQKRAQEDLERVGYAYPKFVQSAEGIAVFDGQTGEELGQAPDLSGAVRIAKAHTVALDDLSAEAVAGLTDDVRAMVENKKAAVGTLMEGARAATELDTKSSVQISFEHFDPSKASAKMAAQYARQVALKELAEGGTGKIARSVLGTSETTFAQGMRTTINSLFRGAAITDVFHETFHGLRRQALRDGVITRADEIALLRGLDQVFGQKTVRRGGARLRFIPEGLTDADLLQESKEMNTILDEAMAEIGEMEVLRTRKKDGKGRLGVPRGVVSRNLSALTKLMPGVVGKWQAFLRAVGARWGLSLTRVAAMKKAERDGTFDKDGYDTFLDKLLGIDGQKEHQAGVMQELDRILALPEELADDDIPFSLGPAEVADEMAGNALARVTDPRRRTQVMSRIARDFNAMRLQIERITSLRGVKRSKGDLRNEAAVREELAADEKIGAIHERYGSLLADVDLVKIKSQPVNAYLADPTSPLRGRLMSKAAAIKAHPDLFQLHRAGEYDGSDGISRSVFGGRLMPDQAAQELYDHGLIAEPTADAMWEALMVEQKTVNGFKELLAKAEAEIRQAKVDAKAEANEWLATQGKDQETNFSDKEEIRRSLRMLDAILLALPPEIRGKIGGYTQISMINSDEARLEYLTDKLAKADKELESFLRVQYDQEFRDLIRRAGPSTNEAGERPSGSIAADAWEILQLADSATTLPFSKGEALADSLDAEAEHEDTTEPQADILRAKAQMVRLTMNWRSADAARREQAVLEGEKIYYGGLGALAIENSRRRERLASLRKDAIKGTGKTGHRMEREAAEHDAKGTGTGKLKQWGWELLSFGQVVDVLFGEKSGVAQWFNARELAASNSLEDAYQAKVDGLEALFTTLAGNRFGGEKLQHKMATEKTITTTDQRGVKQTFSETQAISFLLMWRQEDGRRHMEGFENGETGESSSWSYGEDNAKEVAAQLSPQGKAVLAFLGQSYGEEYSRINEVFRRIWNVSMPRHKLYAPLTVMPVKGKGDTIMDPVTGDPMGVGMTPGSLKNRSNSAIAEPLFKDAFQVYLTHARQMEHFIAYGEFARDALGIINRRETRTAIEAGGGPFASDILSKWVDYFALGGLQKARAGGAMWESIGNAMGRLSSAMLVGRVSVLAMQSLQLGAAAFKMPTGAFLMRFGKLMTGQLNWWAGENSIIQTPYIQRRLAEMPPAVRDMMRGIAAGTPRRAKHLAGLAGRTIAHADAFFTAGTYAMVYDYHLKQAKAQGVENPEAEAHRQAELLTDQLAQPVRPGARSWLEVSTQGDPAFRAMWNFSTDPRQKFALWIYQMMRRDTKGAAKAAHIGKTGVILWTVSGVGATLLRAVMRDLREDDDDELFDERHWSLKRLALMAATGPFGGIPIVGDALEDSTYKATGQYLPQGGLLSSLGDAAALPLKWSKGKVDVLKDAEALATAASSRSMTAAAAANLMHLIRDIWGVTDNFTDWED